MSTGPDAATLQRYLGHLQVQKRLAARTLVLYGEHLAALQRHCEGAGLGWAEVQEHHVRRWAAQLRASGRAPRGIALVLSVWRGFYTWLGREGLIAAHPLLNVRAPKAAQPLPKALGVQEALRLAEQAGQMGQAGQVEPTNPARERAGEPGWLALQDHCLVELLYGSGLRIGELLGLDTRPSAQARGWVDLQAAEAQVLGKGGKWRAVPVGTHACQALVQWLQARQQAWLESAEPALFLGQRGARLTPQVARRRLLALAQAAGLAGRVHPHMLRHSFASHLLQSSADLRAVQELLGHADIRSTQIYTRLDFQHLASAYEAAHPRARKR